MPAANKILIAVTGEPPKSVAERHGDYVTMMREAIGGAWDGGYDHLDLRKGEKSEQPYAGIVITGSSASVHRREDWIVQSEGWLRKVVERGTPVLGVCFGHQLLAQALGGEVIKNPRGREMSTVTVELTDGDPLFEGLPIPTRVNACHSDTVSQLPPGAAVLARSPLDPHQCLRFRDSCYGVQFHPEFDGDIMRAYVDARRELLLAEQLDPQELRAAASHTPAGPLLMKNFVKHFIKRPPPGS